MSHKKAKKIKKWMRENLTWKQEAWFRHHKTGTMHRTPHRKIYQLLKKFPELISEKTGNYDIIKGIIETINRGVSDQYRVLMASRGSGSVSPSGEEADSKAAG